ncbi:MAG: DUF2177 family protein [Gammaproteobacteria bacterium]
MKHLILLYIIAAFFYLGLDMVWLNVFAKHFYQSQLGSLMLERPLLWAAALVYLLYPVGLVAFIVEPSLANGASSGAVLIKGVFFGVLVYATYDLTNLATLKGWSTTLAVVDVLWGGFVSGGASLATFLIFKRFFA